MAHFPENFGLIHKGEESILRDSIAAIEAADDLCLHAEMVEVQSAYCASTSCEMTIGTTTTSSSGALGSGWLTP